MYHKHEQKLLNWIYHIPTERNKWPNPWKFTKWLLSSSLVFCTTKNEKKEKYLERITFWHDIMAWPLKINLDHFLLPYLSWCLLTKPVFDVIRLIGRILNKKQSSKEADVVRANFREVHTLEVAPLSQNPIWLRTKCTKSWVWGVYGRWIWFFSRQ